MDLEEGDLVGEDSAVEDLAEVDSVVEATEDSEVVKVEVSDADVDLDLENKKRKLTKNKNQETKICDAVNTLYSMTEDAGIMLK